MVRDARRTLQIVVNHCPRGKNWLDCNIVIVRFRKESCKYLCNHSHMIYFSIDRRGRTLPAMLLQWHFSYNLPGHFFLPVSLCTN